MEVELYDTLVQQFSQKGIQFIKTDNGYSIPFSETIENCIAKLLQDFYYLNGYNVLLLNQNGNCKFCLEINQKDRVSLLEEIYKSFVNYLDDVDYIGLLDRDVKATLSLFKKSRFYSGNFGIGVKNLEGM